MMTCFQMHVITECSRGLALIHCTRPGLAPDQRTHNYGTILYASMTNLTIRTTKHKAEESQSLHCFVSMNTDHSTFPEYAKRQDQYFYMVSLWYPICTSKWKKVLLVMCTNICHGHGSISQTVDEFIIQNSSCSYMNDNVQIKSQFCTCHHNWAVMTCANLWPGWIIKIILKTKEALQDFIDELICCLWDGFLVSSVISGQ